MKIEDQVCSLELAKKLKELGVKQESLFYWQQSYQEMKGGQTASFFEITQVKKESKKGMMCFSAFTVAELGEMLPKNYVVIKKEKGFESWKLDTKNYELETMYPNNIKADTEADARAKMLIYLLENKLI